MFTFDKSIETGNVTIDTEHKQLIGAINSLLGACIQGRSREEAQKAMQFLVSYTTQHFSHEESLQKQYGYPGFAEHHQMHEGYKKVVHDLSVEFNRVGPTPAMINKINTSIGDWLIRHIRREDAKVAAHIREKTGK